MIGDFVRRTSVATLGFALLLVVATPVLAATKIPQSVLSNGGASMSGAKHSLRGTLGQVSIGTLRNDGQTAFLGYWYNPYTIATDVETPSSPGLRFALGQNSPNPFNPRTVIPFALARNAHVQLKVVDARGRHVATLIDEEMPAGAHEVVFTPKTLASGLYFAQLVSDGNVQTRKLLLLK